MGKVSQRYLSRAKKKPEFLAKSPAEQLETIRSLKKAHNERLAAGGPPKAKTGKATELGACMGPGGRTAMHDCALVGISGGGRHTRGCMSGLLVHVEALNGRPIFEWPLTLGYDHITMGNGQWAHLPACHHAGKGAVKKKSSKAAGGSATAAISAVASGLLASAKLTRKAEKPTAAAAEKGSSGKKRKEA